MNHLRPVIIALLAIAVLSLVLIGRDTAYASFNPTASASLSDTTPGANADIRTEFNLPAPNVNFSAVITFTPADFFVATDADIPNGDGVAFLKAGVTIGLINGPCSPGGITAEFQMMDATTNTAGPTVIIGDDPADPGTTGEIFEGESTDSWATAAELPKGAAMYPDFLLRMFKDENGQTLQPRARLYGQTQVVGNDIAMNFVIFEPGTTFKNPITGQLFMTDPALGYPTVTILHDLGDPVVQPNPDSTITDFCTPLDTVITTCGLAQENRSLMNRNDPCPSGSGTPARTNPSSDMTLNFITYAVGQPDADGDGLENGFDTCPYDINEENPRQAAFRDSDGIDSACDPDPDDWCGGEPDAFSVATKFGSDCDRDEFVNASDNCPLVANPDQADADYDQIGDACDRDSTTAEGGRPVVCLVMPVDIGAGGTPPPGPNQYLCTEEVVCLDVDGNGNCDFVEPTSTTVSIDVKPGSDLNSTNLGSQGVIPVAILTTDTFDAASVDPATVRFEGASPVHHTPEDVDKDGDLDLIMHFRTQVTEIADDATEACLTGETFDGQPIQGCDVIRIVPPSLDSDGDGFGDAVEASLRTDQFASCSRNPQHDAWPVDADMDTDADIGDVIALFAGILLNPAGYQPRSDFNADGDVDMGDLIAGLRDKIFTNCG